MSNIVRTYRRNIFKNMLRNKRYTKINKNTHIFWRRMKKKAKKAAA